MNATVFKHENRGGQTPKVATIDGITAPWYLILAYGNDDMGMDVEEAWIFGGYVKEIKSS